MSIWHTQSGKVVKEEDRFQAHFHLSSPGFAFYSFKIPLDITSRSLLVMASLQEFCHQYWYHNFSNDTHITRLLRTGAPLSWNTGVICLMCWWNRRCLVLSSTPGLLILKTRTPTGCQESHWFIFHCVKGCLTEQSITHCQDWLSSAPPPVLVGVSEMSRVTGRRLCRTTCNEVLR